MAKPSSPATAALPLPLPPPPLINAETITQQPPGQDNSLTKIDYYTSPGQIPFVWEAEPGKRKEGEEDEVEERSRQVAPPPPLNPPPNMQSPAVSRTSSAVSDMRATSSNGRMAHTEDYMSRRTRGKSAHKNTQGEADVDAFRSGCKPFFCFTKWGRWSGRKVRNC